MKRLQDLITAEPLVVTIIVINTIALIGMGYTDPDFSRFTSPDAAAIYAWSSAIDLLCVGYFIVEIAIKIRTDGWKTFWTSGWNRFDFVVVVLSAPVLLSPVLLVRELWVLLSLRLGRLFRLFRLLRFIPNREHLWHGVKRALKASVGVFLALVLINIVLSIGANQLFARVAPEYFGDPVISSYSLFRIFTIEGWYEIPEEIAARVAHPLMSVLARLYFMGSVLVGGFLGVGLANAVFVDEMTIDNNADLESKVDQLISEVQALRRQWDESR